MKQTAVEWLEEEMLKGKFNLKDTFEQAKEMEKQQIIQTFDIACEDENRIGIEYYNENFKKEQGL